MEKELDTLRNEKFDMQEGLRKLQEKYARASLTHATMKDDDKHLLKFYTGTKCIISTPSRGVATIESAEALKQI